MSERKYRKHRRTGTDNTIEFTLEVKEHPETYDNQSYAQILKKWSKGHPELTLSRYTVKKVMEKLGLTLASVSGRKRGSFNKKAKSRDRVRMVGVILEEVCVLVGYGNGDGNEDKLAFLRDLISAAPLDKCLSRFEIRRGDNGPFDDRYLEDDYDELDDELDD